MQRKTGGSGQFPFPQYFRNMKSIFAISLLLITIFGCRKEKETPCHTEVISELIIPVFITDPYLYKEHVRTSIRCAGKCPDGMPCDSMIELTNASMGASVRRVRCSCKNEQIKPECGIILERIRYEGDSIKTRLLCSHKSTCAIASDTCIVQEKQLATDTIRSRITQRDSLIIKRWVATCECK